MPIIFPYAREKLYLHVDQIILDGIQYFSPMALNKRILFYGTGPWPRILINNFVYPANQLAIAIKVLGKIAQLLFSNCFFYFKILVNLTKFPPPLFCAMVVK